VACLTCRVLAAPVPALRQRAGWFRQLNERKMWKTWRRHLPCSTGVTLCCQLPRGAAPQFLFCRWCLPLLYLSSDFPRRPFPPCVPSPCPCRVNATTTCRPLLHQLACPPVIGFFAFFLVVQLPRQPALLIFRVPLSSAAPALRALVCVDSLSNRLSNRQRNLRHSIGRDARAKAEEQLCKQSCRHKKKEAM